MRAGHTARSPAEAKAFPLVDAISHLHLYFGQVHVERGELLPVIDDHQVALVEHALGDDDHSIVGGDHRRSGRGMEVGSAMDARQLTVEHAAGPKRIGRCEGHGRLKAAASIRAR